MCQRITTKKSFNLAGLPIVIADADYPHVFYIYTHNSVNGSEIHMKIEARKKMEDIHGLRYLFIYNKNTRVVTAHQYDDADHTVSTSDGTRTELRTKTSSSHMYREKIVSARLEYDTVLDYTDNKIIIQMRTEDGKCQTRYVVKYD